MYTGIDLETSGLEGKPRIIQLAALSFTPRWELVGEVNVLIKPEGLTAQEGAAEAVHGISIAEATKYGIPLPAALACLQGLVMASSVVYGFGVQGYDRGVIADELTRLGSNGAWWHRCSQRMLDLKEICTPICKLPGEYGHKWPSLTEAHKIICADLPMPRGHSAKGDTIACTDILRTLIARGEINMERLAA